MSSPVLPAGKSVQWVISAFEAPVPPATVGVQVTNLSSRPGDTLIFSQQAGGVPLVVGTDPTDPTGLTGKITAPAGTSGAVTVQAIYKNADGSTVTLLQNLSVVNLSDVVSLSGVLGTPA